MAKLEFAAVKLCQHPELPLFLFGLSSGELLELASVAHAQRDDGGDLIGYQRPEVQRHVAEIASYLRQEQVLFPNAVVLCLESAQFRSHKPRDRAAIQFGTLRIPQRKGRPAAWVVDGQQRMLALKKSGRADLPIPATAFVTDALAVQREQFLRVNNARPLPRGLITELLPSVDQPITANLERFRLPSLLSEMLNTDPASPLFRRIRRASHPATPGANISDNAVVQMLKRSLHTPSGCLFAYQNVATGELQVELARRALVCYWEAVRRVFPEAWSLPPSRSRLTHGAGIQAMGRLMDRVLNRLGPETSVESVSARLESLKPHCAWTRGHWRGLDGLAWNGLQNVQAHIKLLSEFLIHTYLSEWSEAA
ncbi:MAG: DGQHR domain-containing protein DpdB [Vulcanimicrobiota bacterium]